jgi:hypothetical protein
MEGVIFNKMLVIFYRFLKCCLKFGVPLHRWRTMLYAACVPGFLIVAGMQFAVESPRWLAKVPRLS